MGTGLGHFIPLIAYLGFWVMMIVSLTGRPLLGFYYMLPFLPYRTMRDHFLDLPFGGSVLTFLVIAVLIGALTRGKRLPKSRLYLIWLGFGIYLYLSMWLGTMLGNAPAPLWINDLNFATWKDYMLIPLVFVAAGLVVEDRKAVRTVLIIAAVSLLFIDRSCLMDSMTRTWTTFDEDKRGGGPLGYGSNQTAAFLAQFAMFFWGAVQFIKRKKIKLAFYGLVALTLLADMYTFSRGSYLAVLFSVFVLGFLKDRKLLVLGVLLLFTWQIVLPTAVRERISMTQDSNGQLEASAEERVKLWEEAKSDILSDPVFGIGFATYQLGTHVDGLKDTHNWYVKVLVETGLVGAIFVVFLLQQTIVLTYRLFKTADDPLYKALGLGLLLATSASIIANLFGDRWTYLEITGLLWALIGTATRAVTLTNPEPTHELAEFNQPVGASPFHA